MAGPGKDQSLPAAETNKIVADNRLTVPRLNMHRNQLLQLLDTYRTGYIEEAAMVDKTRCFVRAHPDCFDRSLGHGHVSGSAWVLNPSRSHVFLMHHRKLNLWLQPGGHADNNHDIVDVALSETAEEAGVDPDHVRLLNDRIFDVDVHSVHATPTEPRHQHYDIRFLVELDDGVPLHGNNESYAVAWVPLNQVMRLNNFRSTYRMVEKTRAGLRAAVGL
jgi:8-oxo-dGTP pyrophosphatase MutT (NUDIX family)